MKSPLSWLTLSAALAFAATEVALVEAEDAGVQPEVAGRQTEARAQRMVTPIYPAEAIARKLEGRVVVCFEIDEQGRVRKPRVRESSHVVFDAAVLKAVSASTYQPALENDQPVSAASCRTYTFRLAPDG